MERNRLTLGQFLAVMLVGAAAPLIQTGISRAAWLGGRMGWLGPLAAALPAALIIFLIHDAAREPDADLFTAMCGAFGEVAGRAVALAYLLFSLFPTALALREYGERFVSTIFTGKSVALFLGVMMLLVLFSASRSLQALGRASRIFGGGILAIALGVAAFAAADMDLANLLPLRWEGAARALPAALPTLHVLTAPVHMTFLLGSVRRERRGALRASACFAAMCLGLGAVAFVAVGCFGAGYTAASNVMFFTMAKGVRIFAAAQHVESVVVAAWVLSDFVLLTAEVLAACRVLSGVFRVEDRRVFVLPVSAALFVAALTVTSGMMEIENDISPILIPLNVGVNFVLVISIWGLQKLRKKFPKKSEKKC